MALPVVASAEYMREYRKREPEIVQAVSHRHYDNHKEDYIVWRNEARQRIWKLVREARSVSCMDCGHLYPYYVMEFDHVRGEKKFNISSATAQGINKVREELKKCDVVCANCHVIRTFKRGQWFRGNPRKLNYKAGEIGGAPNMTDLRTREEMPNGRPFEQDFWNAWEGQHA